MVCLILLLGLGNVLFLDRVKNIDVNGHADHVLHLEQNCAHRVFKHLVQDYAISHGQMVGCTKEKQLK